MKKITILALHMNYGGIEKAISDFANLLCNDFQIEIVSIYNFKPAFEIDDKVTIKYLLNKKPNKKELIDSLKKLRIKTFIKEVLNARNLLKMRKKKLVNFLAQIDTDIIISTRALLNKYVSQYVSKECFKVAWEHNHFDNKKNTNKLIKSLLNINNLVVVSKEIENYYKNKLDDKNVNYIPLIVNNKDLNPKFEKKEIIYVGRLSKEKGVEDLVKLMEIIDPEIKLHIFGDGVLKDILIRESESKKLNIEFHGFQTSDIIDKYRKKCFCSLMVSYTESFGLVVAESLASGLPVVAFDTAKGPLEILKNNVNSFIITNRDFKQMAETIEELFSDKERLNKFSANAINSTNDFKKENVKEIWLEYLKNK